MLIQRAVEALQTSSPTWRIVDEANEALDRARREGAPKLVHWNAWWARRVASLGCDLAGARGVLELEGWGFTDVIESAIRLIPEWERFGRTWRAHPGDTLNVLVHEPSDPRPYFDALLALSQHHACLEPGFGWFDRLVELEAFDLALEACLVTTWPATLNHACFCLEPVLQRDQLQRLAKHAFPYLATWHARVGVDGYGIEPRALLLPYLETKEREEEIAAIESQLGKMSPAERGCTQDFETPVASLARALALMGERDRAREVEERFTVRDEYDEQEIRTAILYPERAKQRRRQRSRKTADSPPKSGPLTEAALVARRLDALRRLNDTTLLQVGYQLSPALFAELRPQLEEAVPPDKLAMMGNPWDAARDCSEEAWRSALDQGKPSERHWILLAQAEGDAMMRSITEQLLGTNV